MSVTYGFYNSVPDAESGIGDRRYTAEQLSSIFDGIINDGIYEGYGTAFEVKASSDGSYITVGTGRAWFDHTWTLNDTTLVIQGSDIPVAHDTLNRYDAVVIEVNSNESYRQNTIKIVEGTPATTPKKPTMEDTATLHQYPLAYIYRKYASTTISQSDIVNNRGLTGCPFVTGIVQILTIDSFVAQWQSEFYDWNTEKRAEFSTWSTERKAEFETWFDGVKDILNQVDVGELYNMIRSTSIVTFAADGWSEEAPYTQTVTVTGITAASVLSGALDTRNCEDENAEKAMKKAYGYLTYFETGADTITATAKFNKPAVDVTIAFRGA